MTRGVIHRDIKPENILMSVDGAVKIADFGLSRILGSDEQQHTLTATHQVMGTPRYMAPEQLEGAHSVDHRADIYSLGVVIYEMLTGELPIGRFAVPSAKVEIDVRLDDVVLRTLEKEPQRRYQRASQIKSDVQSITSSDHPGFAPTIIRETSPERATSETQLQSGSLEQQELAGRLLITRRQLLDRVENAMKPLFRGQMLQVFVGVLFIALGAQCWARNTHVPHRLICGAIVHIYGIMVIAQAATVATKIKRIDYSQTVEEIREKLDRVGTAYRWAGIVIGFVWWLMWIPVCVAIGFDAVVIYRNSFLVSLVIGILGFIVSLGLYLWALRPANPSAEVWKTRASSESLANAYRALKEMEQANIR